MKDLADQKKIELNTLNFRALVEVSQRLGCLCEISHARKSINTDGLGDIELPNSKKCPAPTSQNGADAT